MILDNIKEEINKAKTIVILTHENPDGDAIGSSLSMYLGLKQLGKEADVIIQKFSKNFNFLPSIDKIKTEGQKEPYDLAIALDSGDIKRFEELKTESNIENYDLAISLDCATIKMLNGFANYFENAKVKVSIDHHSTNTMFGDYNFVDPTAPACSQILITVLKELNIEITKEIGICLLTGIITDTGGFKYPGVKSETFEFVAELLERGVNVSEIYKNVLQTISKEKFELRKIAMNRIELLEEGKIAFTYITKKDEEETAELEAVIE